MGNEYRSFISDMNKLTTAWTVLESFVWYRIGRVASEICFEYVIPRNPVQFWMLVMRPMYRMIRSSFVYSFVFWMTYVTK